MTESLLGYFMILLMENEGNNGGYDYDYDKGRIKQTFFHRTKDVIILFFFM